MGHSIFSNGINLLISLLLVLIVPKALGITSYGYWQLYVFYTTFSGFVNLGWVEGVYLDYGGKDSQSINSNDITLEYKLFLLYALSASFLLFSFGTFFADSTNERFIFQMFAIATFLTVSRGFLQYLFQSIDEIKRYSKSILLDRFVYATIVTVLLSNGYNDYKGLIILDILSKLVGFIYTLLLSRDILVIKTNFDIGILRIIKGHFLIGISLFLSNIASQLIMSVSRIMIKNKWSIEIFGKVSLGLSLISFFMVFINAIGVVVFPFLKKMNSNNYACIYIKSYNIFSIIMCLILIFYYPVSAFVSLWLPNYLESIKYMVFLFPICIFESITLILTNSFLKAERQEKKMFKINFISFILSFIINGITYYLFNSVDIMLFGLLFSIGFKSMYSSTILRGSLNISGVMTMDFILIFSTLFFIGLNQTFVLWHAFIFYLVYIIVLLFVGRRKKFIKV